LESISYARNKFEVLIVDDGSTHPLNDKELKLQFPGMIIQVIRLDHNQGIVHALNEGLNALKNRNDIKYIARLDAGDTCMEQRFYKQVAVLDTQPDIALLASWARFEDIRTGKGYDYITQTTHNSILKEMHYKCTFIHPSVMFRKEVLNTVGLYPTNYPHAEDYAFFWNILKKYKGAVVPEILVKITFSDVHVSAQNYKKQLQTRKKIVHDFGENTWHQWMGIRMLTVKSLLSFSFILKLKSF
ncbi:MAG TPA: glycosyltransferase, partial [Bacteroidia bacterium]|nr:glycosyltransferase [Bacteroidia bacterium]